MKRNSYLLTSSNILDAKIPTTPFPLPAIISSHDALFIFLMEFTTISDYHTYCLPPSTTATVASV